MTDVLIERGNLDTEICIKGKQREETQGEDHLQAKDRDLEQILPSQLSEGTHPADTLILDF